MLKKANVFSLFATVYCAWHSVAHVEDFLCFSESKLQKYSAIYAFPNATLYKKGCCVHQVLCTRGAYHVMKTLYRLSLFERSNADGIHTSVHKN